MFDVDELMRGDAAAMNTALNLQRQNGIISANGWLRRLGRDDQISEQDGGNALLVNGNMISLLRAMAATVPAPVPATGVAA
jgi:hypothetical protein